MNVLLLATSRALPASVVDEVRRELAALPEVVIDVVTWLPPAEPLGDVTRQCVVVGPPPGAGAAPAPSPPRNRALHLLRRLVLGGGVSRRFWRRLRRREDVAAAAREAAAIVALDSGAIRAAWHLARRHPSPIVTLGATAAVRELSRTG